jgi:hypothetical protein
MFEVAMLIGFSMTVYLVEVHAYFKRNKPRAKPPIVVMPKPYVNRRFVVIKGKRHDTL